MALIGTAVLDLDGPAILRMTRRAFESALLSFQGNVDVFGGLTVRPCLTAEQRSAIRRALKIVYGYPSRWNFGTVASACCSLDVLSVSELNDIRDDLILDGCPKCLVDEPTPFHLLALKETIQTACLFELGSEEIQNGLVLGNQQLAARRASAAFNTYRDGRIYVRGINQPPANQTGGTLAPLSCDAVVAAGSGAGFPLDQLKTLTDEDIKDCLYELGAQPLSPEQAGYLWGRVKQVHENRVPKSQLVQLGWIQQGIDPNSDRNSFRLDDWDVIAAFGSVNRQLSAQQVMTFKAPLGSFQTKLMGPFRPVLVGNVGLSGLCGLEERARVLHWAGPYGPRTDPLRDEPIRRFPHSNHFGIRMNGP